MSGKNKNVMELMVIDRLITKDQLGNALAYQKTHGGNLTTAAIKKGIVSESQYLTYMSKKYNISPINLDNFDVTENLKEIIPENIARKYNVIPVSEIGGTLVVALFDPTDSSVIDSLAFYTKRKIKPVLASETALEKAILRTYMVKDRMENVVKELKVDGVNVIELSSRKAHDMTKDGGVAIIKFINSMILQAIRSGASDIHIEPYRDSMRIRYRIDGVLQEKIRPDKQLSSQLISRLKIMSELDIAEKRLPQDGRVKVKLGESGKMVDFRVSSVPCIWGEKIVMRTIDDSNLQVDMTKLGFEPDDLKKFKDAIARPKGMILITGPTGSGKTQTLYSSLLELNDEHVNISTAEDPVEYNLEGINQVHIKEEIDLTFARALKAFLRQDPDIIMIGEIRDKTTADIAIKAALTGHLVFSTLHTNDSPSTINRIIDMGVESYNLMPALNLIAAQRLARKICPKCKEERSFVPHEIIKLGVPPEKISNLKVYKGRGCSHCSRTGYKGRIGVFEVMPITSDISEAVLKGASANDIKKEALRGGMRTLRDDAINKFVKGVIDIDEVVRVTTGD